MNQAIQDKSYDYTLYNKPAGVIEKQIQWARKETNTLKKVMKVALLVLEALALPCTVIGIPFVVKGIQTLKHLNHVDSYLKKYENVNPPRINDPITMKTSTHTFNHVNEYIIHKDVVWYRRTGQEQKDWKPMYFDAKNPSTIPVKISSDGANLVVVDNYGEVHYRKVLKEYKQKNVLKNAQVHIKNNSEIKGEKHLVVDKSHVPRWKDRWFSLPYISPIVNLVMGKKLKIDPNAKAVAISQRGNYSNHTEDAVGQKHEVDEGVTTLYVLTSSGKQILKYDPWAPTWAKAEIYLPETQKTYFEAENMSCSASTIMLVGYEIDRTTGEKTLKIQTRLADIDTEGGNPGAFEYDYKCHPDDPYVRVLSGEAHWQEHPFKEGAEITGDITVRQTGEGNNARELRVVGTYEGEKGYFHKAITSSEWIFNKCENASFQRSQYLVPTGKEESPLVKGDVSDYEKGQLTIGKNNSIDNVKIENFGKHSTSSKITFKHNDKDYSLNLYRRITLWDFLGFDKKRYDLVVPLELQSDKTMKKLFGGKASYEVKVKTDRKRIQISTNSKGQISLKFPIYNQ